MKSVIKKFFQAAWPMAAIFLFDNLVNNPLGIYDRWPSYDIPMHIFGGVVTTWCLVRFLKSLKVYTSLKPRWLRYWFLIANAGLIGILWEFYEWTFDYFFPWIGVQTSLADTIGDLLNDLLGASIFIAIMLWQVYKKSPQPVQETESTRSKPAKSRKTKK